MVLGDQKQPETILSPLPQSLWPPDLAGWWLTLKGVYPKCHSTLCSCVFTRSRDRLKPLYLFYHSVYGHKTWHGGYIQWGASFHKVKTFITWPCKVMWQVRYVIFSTTMPMATKLNRVIIYNEEIPSIKSQDPLTWSCKIAWQIQYDVSLLPQDLWSMNMARWWLTLRGFRFFWDHVASQVFTTTMPEATKPNSLVT